ncbi:hypothetical protein GA0070612_6087 [Micromonospora chokoriensis]|uniref:Uncharacterized protein n=1 Tax=Micromonospora chokoriensis TaxID=356851 RepID=A0A1C4ZAS7_9ACTN|nr:hypothetical protein GA0070612_6087 [Micromonospora chokoriensis]
MAGGAVAGGVVVDMPLAGTPGGGAGQRSDGFGGGQLFQYWPTRSVACCSHCAYASG